MYCTVFPPLIVLQFKRVNGTNIPKRQSQIPNSEQSPFPYCQFRPPYFPERPPAWHNPKYCKLSFRSISLSLLLFFTATPDVAGIDGNNVRARARVCVRVCHFRCVLKCACVRARFLPLQISAHPPFFSFNGPYRFHPPFLFRTIDMKLSLVLLLCLHVNRSLNDNDQNNRK